jgi:hypothetical protein
MTSSERLCAQPTEDAPRAPDLSRFARELRVRQQNRRVGPVWQKTSPSTQQMIARCVVRDTRAPGLDRCQWRSRSWVALADRSGARYRPGRGAVARGNRARGLCLPARDGPGYAERAITAWAGRQMFKG